MMLRRLELAIDYKQKKFVAHPNIQQLLAALWYEGLPGFRRKAVIDKCLEIVKVVALFPLYCLLYILSPDSPTGTLIRTPFMKFLIHSASYLFFLLMLILVSVRFENLVIWLFGTENMRRNLEEAMRKQRGNLPTPTECLVVLWVFGFIWEEIKEIYRHGLRKYLRNMWNILDIMRDSLYICTLFLRILAYIQQWQEIVRNPNVAYIPREEWNSFDPQLISEGLFAAANILSALKLVHIFSINPYLGPLQISLGRMVIDIVKFFFIYTLVLFAFACGLTQLLWYYNDLEKQKCYSLPGGLADWKANGDACMKWRRWHNLFEASQSLFWAGFGMVGLDDFELTGIREYTRFWSMLMFGSYSVINIIVLLNLLIAMMSSSYSFIVEHADTEWKFARTKLWMSYFEMGNTLPPPFNIFPTPKSFMRMCGKNSRQEELVRRMSSRTQSRRRKARDYRYLSVMRALLWRYVCSLQRRNEERPINEDDISEVKGDISSLRFELIDLFGANGMDVSTCAKKSRAALGRKMRVWERRLMRDFHVSPAMGSEDPNREVKEAPVEEGANSRFKRVAKLAMANKPADLASIVEGAARASQIGIGNMEGRENLKEAIEKARRRMEEGTPDGSPGSSRGCSPFPDLYTGPHLLDAIKSLDLSPHHSPAETPMPPADSKGWHQPAKDGQAKDLTKLTVPGRRSPTCLKRTEGSSNENVSLDVPTNVFSKDSIKKLSGMKKAETEKKDAAPPSPPCCSRAHPPPVAVGLRRIEGESAVRRPVAPRVQQVQQQQAFTGSDDLESVDFVRRPSRLPPKPEPKEDIRKSVTPTIAVTPSTPAPTETPVPPSPPAKIPTKFAIDKTPPPTPRPGDKPAEIKPAPKPEASKPAAKPAEKAVEKPAAEKPAAPAAPAAPPPRSPLPQPLLSPRKSRLPPSPRRRATPSRPPRSPPRKPQPRSRPASRSPPRPQPRPSRATRPPTRPSR
ncbi:putative TRPL channel protein [Penaeus vannamei]|uniref:Putative TRPL channel protein n=1 Tax=Penaeus vannamei TaxID=6689 RepID=A0A3R7MC77_PENVA|nr:putative TRPL channel protein [Penaeus vannamei]